MRFLDILSIKPPYTHPGTPLPDPTYSEIGFVRAPQFPALLTLTPFKLMGYSQLYLGSFGAFLAMPGPCFRFAETFAPLTMYDPPRALKLGQSASFARLHCRFLLTEIPIIQELAAIQNWLRSVLFEDTSRRPCRLSFDTTSPRVFARDHACIADTEPPSIRPPPSAIRHLPSPALFRPAGSISSRT